MRRRRVGLVPAAAGPAIFVVNGSVTLYNVTGSGFTATGGQPTNNNAGAGMADATAVFNYGGTVNGSTTVGPIANAFTVSEPVGQFSAAQTATLTFTSNYLPSLPGIVPFSTYVFTQGALNKDFTFAGGTCNPGISYAVGDTCTVQYFFKPTSPGIRYGGITLTSASAVTSANPNGTLASILISGIGTGPQVVFNAPLTPSTLGGGFNYPEGVAVDGSGTVYVGDSGHKAVKMMANTCTSSSCVTTLGGGFNRLYDVAVDGSGNVYVADSNNNAVKVMTRATPPTVAFATTTTDGTTDTTDGTQTVTVQNIGNAALPFAIPGSGVTNPTTPHDFTFTATGGSACPSLTSSASTTGTLAAGATCNIPLTFTPVSPTNGALSESLTLTDTNLNATAATQAISLTGTAVLPTPASTLNSTVVASPNPAVAGSTVTVSVTLKDAGGNAINGATGSFSSSSTTASFGTPSVTGNVISVSMTDTAAETAPISITLGGAASGTLTGSAQFVAPAYVVTVNTDETSGNGTAANCVDPNISSSGNTNCSLRDAVAAANALSGVAANISFSLPYPSTIVIAQQGGITISQSVNLNGPGANLLTIEGGTTPLSTSNNRILQISGGNVSISGLTFANGYGGNGGAIYTTGNGTLTVSSSTFSGNSANNGGAIQANSTLTVSNSTFSGNSANFGGAINFFSTLTVSNSIFSGDTAPHGSGINAFGGGTVDHVVYNGDTFSGVTPTASLNADPKLSPLGNYGGPTPTLLPLPDSAAICAGSQPTLNSTPLATDQRGVTISPARYGQTACYDIGAVQTEYALAGPLTVPSQVQLGSAISPAPTVSLTENGTPFTGAATVAMTDAQSDLAPSATVLASPSTSSGQASFSNLLFTAPEASDALTATLTLNSNPTPAISLSATSNSFQIGQLTQTITGFNPSTNAVYGQTRTTLSATGGGSGNPVTFRVVGACPGFISGNQLTITGAGVITVEADQLGNTTYSAAMPVIVNIVVSPKALTVNIIGNPTKVYDGTFTATLTPANYQVGGLVGTDAITVNQTSGAYTQIDASSMPISLSALLASSNFTAISGSLTNYSLPSKAFGTGLITPAPLTVSAGSYTGVYDGSSHALSACVTSANPDNLTCTNNPAGPVGPDVGGTTVTPVISSPTGNYSPTNYTVTNNPGAWSITPKSVTLTAGSYTGTYDGNAHAPSACTSSYAGVTCTNSPASVGPAVGSGVVNPVPSYTTGSAADYIVTKTTGSYSITKLAASVTPNPATKVYGMTDPALTGSFSGFLSADGIMAMYTRVSGESVGGSPYTISATLSRIAALNNYAITYNTAGFTITQASQAISFSTAPPASATYNTQFTVVATGGGSGIALGYASAGGCSNTGATYTMTSGTTACTVTVSQAGNTNYAAATNSVTTVIANLASQSISFSTAPPSSATYNTQFTVVATGGGSGIALGYASSGGCSNVGATYTMTSGTTACTVTVSQGGNTNYAAATNSVSMVTASLANPTLNFATIPQHTYGDVPFSVSATSASTGSVNYSLVSGLATVGSTSGLVTLSGAGTVKLSASQQATSNYAQAPATTQFTVLQQASTTALGLSSSSITPLQTVTLTATVAPTVAGSVPPTGSVTFFDASTAPATQIGSSVNLANGQAQLAGVSFVSGPHILYASYSGDANYSVSGSSIAASNITVAAEDFTFIATGYTTQSVVPGTAGTFTFQLAPLYDKYPGPVVFTVTGLPPSATYTVTPTTIATNASPQTVTVTINTPQAIVMHTVGRSAPWALALLLPVLLLRRARRKLGHVVALSLLLSVGTFALSGCGSNTNGYFGQSVKNYTVTVTGTSGAVTHSSSITLQVQ